MEQVEDQVYLTAKEVTHLLEQATQSIADDVLADDTKEERLSDECKRLETALHISEKRFEMVVASTPIVLNTYDRSGIITL